MQITTIILAGGLSKRMGTDKALLEIEGKTLLERAISLCKPFSSELLISSNHKSHTSFGYRVVEDEIKNCGPMGGIYSCLKQSDNAWNLVLSVDAAYINDNFLEFLISNAGDFDAVVPFTEKGAEPLIALYNKSICPAMEKKLQAGDYRVQNLLRESNTKWLDSGKLLEENKRLFTNLNRPEDL
ncbi:molybdenum cofactor guanylyltransferase [uncultured Draconibacterium sp.]|uniref:molybdenum cofactor guanylyltransferase n=1 Tax=uncultured Draconibacterium sp. TaxID=1573823 RepID=UPI002AA8691E|nr:molybdenum cofactor guanylyltransferase [uncultured Draconibacterium sp.]